MGSDVSVPDHCLSFYFESLFIRHEKSTYWIDDTSVFVDFVFTMFYFRSCPPHIKSQIYSFANARNSILSLLFGQ